MYICIPFWYLFSLDKKGGYNELFSDGYNPNHDDLDLDLELSDDDEDDDELDGEMKSSKKIKRKDSSSATTRSKYVLMSAMHSNYFKLSVSFLDCAEVWCTCTCKPFVLGKKRH